MAALSTNFPGVHTATLTHVVERTADWNWPSAHCVQLGELLSVENVPAAQGVQAPAVPFSTNWTNPPGAQSTQKPALAPWQFKRAPLAHGSHEVHFVDWLPVWNLFVPQFLQLG